MKKRRLSSSLFICYLLLCPPFVFANEQDKFHQTKNSTYRYERLYSIPAVIEIDGDERIEGELRYDIGYPTFKSKIALALHGGAVTGFGGTLVGTMGAFMTRPPSSFGGLVPYLAMGGTIGATSGFIAVLSGSKLPHHQRIYFVDNNGKYIEIKGLDTRHMQKFFQQRGDNNKIGITHGDLTYLAKPIGLRFETFAGTLDKFSIDIENPVTPPQQDTSRSQQGIQQERTVAKFQENQLRGTVVFAPDLSPDTGEKMATRFVTHEGRLRPIIIVGNDYEGKVDFIFEDDMEAAQKEKREIKVYSIAEELVANPTSEKRIEELKWSNTDNKPTSAPEYDVVLTIPETDNEINIKYLKHRYHEVRKEKAQLASGPVEKLPCEQGFYAADPRNWRPPSG